jgi:poly(3-hydroxybutyrate) depolymerase
MFKHLVEGDGESADATKAFYDEYRAVCDMTAEFYLQTVEARIPEAFAAQRRLFVHRGKRSTSGQDRRYRAAGDRG